MEERVIVATARIEDHLLEYVCAAIGCAMLLLILLLTPMFSLH